MNTLSHRLSLSWLLFSNPVELFDRIGRDPCYRDGIFDWIGGLRLQTSVRILDLGCGPGASALELARRRYDVTTLDRSERMIARLRKTAEAQRLIVTTRVGDACETGLLQKSFDVVIGASLLNVVERPGPLVAEALRLLRPGGRASFYFPNPAFNRANALRFIEDNRLQPRSAAILLTWGSAARKFDDHTAQSLFRDAGAEEILLCKHLGGMVSSITGRRAA